MAEPEQNASKFASGYYLFVRAKAKYGPYEKWEVADETNAPLVKTYDLPLPPFTL